MCKSKFFVCILSVLCLQAGNIFCSMSGKVITLNSGKNLLANGDFVGKEEIIFTCGESFVGNGKLDAPVITIKAKKFEFTGTIKCGVKCIITTQEKFDQKMFKREGGGEFVISVDQGCSSLSNQTCDKACDKICEKACDQIYVPVCDKICEKILPEAIGQEVSVGTEQEKTGQVVTVWQGQEKSEQVQGEKDSAQVCEQKQKEFGSATVLGQKQEETLVVPVELNFCGATLRFTKKIAIDILDAIKNDNLQALREIVESNPESKKDEYALTLFMLVAGYYNRMNMVKEFISLGANVNSDKITNYGERPILFAIILKNAEFLKVLLDSGANPNVGGKFFATAPLVSAVCEKNLDCVVALLKSKNIAINAKDLESGLTALMVAAIVGSKEMVEALLNAGADANIRGCNFATAADYAAEKGFTEIADFIKSFAVKNSEAKIVSSETGVEGQEKSVASEKIGTKSGETGVLSVAQETVSETCDRVSEIKGVASVVQEIVSEKKDVTSESVGVKSDAKETVKNSGVFDKKEKTKSWQSYFTVQNCMMVLSVIVCGYLLIREIIEKINGTSKEVDCDLEIVN